jgi:hypothetical protein
MSLGPETPQEYERKYAHRLKASPLADALAGFDTQAKRLRPTVLQVSAAALGHVYPEPNLEALQAVYDRVRSATGCGPESGLELRRATSSDREYFS